MEIHFHAFNLQLDIGGGGGDIGKKINHGGGDGGDDDGDDDDYFDDFDDGDEGDEGGLFRRRILFEEVRITIIFFIYKNRFFYPFMKRTTFNCFNLMFPKEMKFILYLLKLFDRKFVDAVLNEWQKTMMDLPAGLRQAYEMVPCFLGYFYLFRLLSIGY